MTAHAVQLASGNASTVPLIVIAVVVNLAVIIAYVRWGPGSRRRK